MNFPFVASNERHYCMWGFFAVSPLLDATGGCQWMLSSAQRGRAMLLWGWKILKNSHVDIAPDWCYTRYHQVEINKTNRN